MYFYPLYGRVLASNISFPDFQACRSSKPLKRPRDVIRLVKRRSPFFDWPSKAAWKTFDGLEYAARPEDGTVFLRSRLAGRFAVRCGARIIEWKPAGNRSGPLARVLLKGKALGLLLSSFPSSLVLHANVLIWHGRAVLICGPRGRGKSTLSAALLSRGLSLLSDDMGVLRERGRRLFLQAGPPEIRLWPEAMRGFGLDAEAGEPLYPETAKRKIGPAGNARWKFGARPAPLDRMYILTRGKGPARIEPLGEREGFLEVLKHLYIPLLEGRSDLGRQFEMAKRLALSSPPRRLVMETGFDRLEKTVAAVKRDLGR